MTESVTDVIVARSERHEQMTPMVAGSIVLHMMVLGLLLAMPVLGDREEPLRAVMEISLGGGAPGPDSGGLTQMGGRQVQEVAPPEPKPVEAPPAPTPPKMTLPSPKVETKQETRKRPEATAPKPSTGAQVVEGSTPVETRARGTGFGLSSAGGTGGDVKLDVTDFCCREYLEQMRDFIKTNWRNQQGRSGLTVVRFTIRRDGMIEAAVVEQSSGSGLLDLEAQRAVQLANPLPQLPAQYPNSTLTVHMTFRY
jgi:TonB family protein